MKTEKPNTLIVLCQNRGYKKLPKNIPVENLGRDIKKRFHFRRLKIKQIDDGFPISRLNSRNLKIFEPSE